MTKFSIHKISLAAFSGVAVLMLVASVTAPANAAIGQSKFNATQEELRRHCWRIDETFWVSKRRYGCGEKIGCVSGRCVKVVRQPPPRPQRLLVKKGDGGNGGDNGGGQSNNDRGPKGGGRTGGSTGAPN